MLIYMKKTGDGVVLLKIPSISFRHFADDKLFEEKSELNVRIGM